MAIIQMVNKEVIDVKESGDEVYGKVSRAVRAIIQLTATDDNGEHTIWLNPDQISSFMG